jgi:L-fucose isomerase-like protein
MDDAMKRTPKETTSTKSLRIGYLPFYVDYYESICAAFGEEKLTVAKFCAQILAEHGDVVWNEKLILDVKAAEKEGKFLAKQDLDCVVVFTSIAVFGGIPWAALKHLSVPILLWNAQEIQSVNERYSMIEIVRNTGQIGIQALSNTLLREGRKFKVVTGYMKAARTKKELGNFFGIARATSAVRRARLLSIGGPFPLMTDIEIDEEHLREYLGPAVFHVTDKELTRRYLAVSKDRVQAAARVIKENYEVRNLSADEASRSARLCEAVQEIVAEHDVHAGTVNCHKQVCMQNPDIGITACYSLGVQNSLGRPFTCTGDIPTSIGMLILKKLTGVAMYTEVQIVDEPRLAIVIANSGEGEDGMRCKGCPISIQGNTNFKGTHGRGASFAYPLQPGPVTVVSFTPSPKSSKPYRLIVAEGEILDEKMPDVGALAGFFRFKNTDVHRGYTRWLEAGPVHHAGTCPGHWLPELTTVAELLDVEVVGI